jgi:hypothetical protein
MWTQRGVFVHSTHYRQTQGHLQELFKVDKVKKEGLMISGTMYINDIRYVMQGAGPLKVAEIKARLLSRNVKLDETQIIEALELLIRNKQVQRTEIAGQFVKVRVK